MGLQWKKNDLIWGQPRSQSAALGAGHVYIVNEPIIAYCGGDSSPPKERPGELKKPMHAIIIRGICMHLLQVRFHSFHSKGFPRATSFMWQGSEFGALSHHKSSLWYEQGRGHHPKLHRKRQAGGMCYTYRSLGAGWTHGARIHSRPG